MFQLFLIDHFHNSAKSLSRLSTSLSPALFRQNLLFHKNNHNMKIKISYRPVYFIFSRSYGEQNKDEHRIGRNGRSLS